MRKFLFFLFLISIKLSASSQVFDVDTIQFSGDINSHINLVILGDGYQLHELPQFSADANNFTADFFSQAPYSNYRNYFNVFIIKVPSNESGASHPGTATDVSEPEHPVISVDNYFGSAFDQYNIHRLLVATNTTAIANVLANNFPAYDQVIMLVNSPYYGGSGGQFPLASLHATSNEIAIHEIGHSFANLKDEYYPGDVYAAEAINMTQETNPASVKWKNWYGSNAIGIYQHCCGGNSAQWYRPHQDCKMRNLGSSFCAVCIEGTIEKIHSLVSAVETYSPQNTLVSATTFPVTFQLELIKPLPNTLKTEWFLNNQKFAKNIDSVLIHSSDLNVGMNNLTVFIEDTTSMLRIDNHENIHLHAVSWSIDNDAIGGVEINSVINKINIQLYPNPASELVYVSFSTSEKQNLSIELYTVDGKLLNTFIPVNKETIVIPLNEYSQGNYFVRFIADGITLAGRQIIKP